MAGGFRQLVSIITGDCPNPQVEHRTMKFKYINVLILCLIKLDGFSQSLSDENFMRDFTNESFKFSEILPNDSIIDWQFVAGKSFQAPEDEKKLKGVRDSLSKIKYSRYFYEKCTRACFDKYDYDVNDSQYLHCKNICDSTNKYSYWKSKEDYYQKRCIALSRLEYNIEYQYHPNNKSLSDNKSVKEKLSEEQGFATWCPPDFCDWKILSQNEQSIAIVNTYEELLNFLGEIHNEYH